MTSSISFAAVGVASLASVLVAACGAVQVISQQQPAVLSVPAARVSRGDIQQTVSYSGDVRAKEQITVLPKATGRIQRVLVDVGAQVHAGDLLAQLEQDTPGIQLAQARANLEAAQAKLANIQAGGKQDDIDAAQAARAQQEAKLDNMRAQGRPEDVAAANAALAVQRAKLSLLIDGGRAESIAQAQSALDAAEQKLALLQKGALDDVRQAAVSTVNADKAQVASAEAAYAALGGTSAADLEALQNQVDTLNAQIGAAQSVVNSADAALTNLTGSSAADVQAAQSAVDQAQAQLATANATLNQANNPTQASIAQAQAALAQAQAQRQAAESNQTALEQNAAGLCAPFLSAVNGQTLKNANGTACNEAKSAADAAVQAGNAAIEAAQGQLDQLKRGGPPASQTQVHAGVVSAEALVKATQARLDALQNGGVQAQRAQVQAQRDQAQSQLTTATLNLATAQARLDAARSGTLEAQRKAAAAQVEAARQKLTADQSHLQHLVDGPQDEEVQAAQDAVDQATQALAMTIQPARSEDIQAQRAVVEQAKQQLDKAMKPFTDDDIRQQEFAAAQAEAQLRLRQNPYTDQDLQAAQAAVDQAQEALDLAQLGVKETQIFAPVEGIVFDRLVSPGALVGATSPIVVLIPPALEIAVNVEEARLGQISTGQSVSVQVPAYPDQIFSGTIAAIAPAVDLKSRTSSVRVSPIDTDGRLRPGMLAQVRITTAARENTLVVAREAIVGNPVPGTQASVVAIAGDRASRIPVGVGLVSDLLAEITGGLSEGQLVVTGNVMGLNNGDVVAPLVSTAQNLDMPKVGYQSAGL